MKRQIKRIITAILILCLSLIPLSPASAATSTPDVMPLYNNTSLATATVSVEDDGKMTITYSVSGYSSITTKIVVTTYIEKKTLGLFWSRVDIGKTDNQWVDTVNKYQYNASRVCWLPSTGTYRVTVIYKVYGSGGAADEIKRQINVKY